MSLLLAVIADSPRAAYVTLHAPKEDTPLRDFVKRLQFKPVSYARRAVCTAYTPLPSQEAFQLDRLRNTFGIPTVQYAFQGAQ